MPPPRTDGPSSLGLSIALVCLVLAASAVADNEKKAAGVLPVHKGRGRVTEAIGQGGALLDIGGGSSLRMPRGLRIGHSRVLTFRKLKKGVKPSQVHEQFIKVGPTLAFDGAIDARGSPMTLTVRAKVKRKPGFKLVLAMEQAGICEPHNKQHKLGKLGLCSTWIFVDAKYDARSKQLSARFESSGGYRMQFGQIPRDA